MNTLVHYRPSALQIPSETRSTETRDHRCFEILCCLHTANLAPNPLFVQLVIKTLVRQMTSFMLPFFSRRTKLSIFRLCDLRSYSFLGTLIQSWRLREASVMQYRFFYIKRWWKNKSKSHVNVFGRPVGFASNGSVWRRMTWRTKNCCWKGTIATNVSIANCVVRKDSQLRWSIKLSKKKTNSFTTHTNRLVVMRVMIEVSYDACQYQTYVHCERHYSVLTRIENEVCCDPWLMSTCFSQNPRKSYLMS